MIGLQSRPRQRDGILTQQVSGTAVLLDPASGQYYAMNDVGERVWQECSGAHTVREIVSVICQEFDAPAEIITTDVLELLEDLLREHLVIESA